MHANDRVQANLLRYSSLLERSELLGGTPTDLIHHVAVHSVERHLTDKEVLFLKQDPDDFIGFVLTGRIYTVLYGPDGRELIINGIGPGGAVGETALIEPSVRGTSAYACGATRVLMLARRHLGPLLDNPAFLGKALRLLSARLRESSSFVETVCLHRLESRLARYLLAGLGGDPSGHACASLPTNQSILAAMLNASRPKLNAQLQSWKREGLISCQSDRILINDLPRMRRMAALPL
ncbi:Crp/Fnr family transcriptional regulator [Pseudomonas mangiferae]|uniref:Crp/Fnr family transcriptional regulator n=1 Tax=Pseudomonas mangiferae TaxID=2593654 RepID=A0A553GZR1_9PSED|nr:Crp/Fnr family transcriptional regulator [Pseudomonas mangiferae]TRX74978.1 Crp/Fnr family transcriptional regulator [Pseudomonas mangiferae]